MSPPIASFENPVAVRGDAVPVKKDLSVKTAPANGHQAKTLADMENQWESFTFAPIRESQVSRAMSTYLLSLNLNN